MQLTHAQYLAKAQEIEEAGGDGFVLAVLASFTVDFLKPYVLVESDAIGSTLYPWFGPYNQFEQLILVPDSELWRMKPDVLWLAFRPEDVDRYFVYEFPELDHSQARDRLASLAKRLVKLTQQARDSFTGPIFVSNFSILDQHVLDVFDASEPQGLKHLVAEINQQLARELAAISGAHVFDFDGCIGECGGDKWKDPRLWHMARAAVSAKAQVFLAKRLVRAVNAALRTPAKCLVLDLDNTLWGGVLGDDGISGIKLGDDYPGSAFKDFQAALMSYRRRGFLLAIASKNDEATVREALRNHPEMILREDHFAAIEASWDPKPSSIRRIAQKLNIGLDSLVFIDDNPVERAVVKSALPMVKVVELPQEPVGFIGALEAAAYLDKPRVLAEDKLRAHMYQQQIQRKEYMHSQESVEDFLRGLNMQAQVGFLDQSTLERIHQLINKTNQFNLTTRRYGLKEVKDLAASSNSEVLWLRLKDRFGDLGLVCVGILRRLDDKIWDVDTFLMSCRVMGRNVEDAFLSFLAGVVRERGAHALQGCYIKTVKNKPVERFYLDHGFDKVRILDETAAVFRIELGQSVLSWPEHIARTN